MLLIQTANSGASCFARFISSIQIAFALDFLLPDTVRFVPMQLHQPETSAGETDPGRLARARPEARLDPMTARASRLSIPLSLAGGVGNLARTRL